MSRTPLGDRGDLGPGWRIPSVRTAGDGDAGAPTRRSPGLLASSLTGRDRELVRHLVDERSTAQIAAAMSVSRNTARTRIRRVVGKLAVTDRHEIVGVAQVRGLV